MPYYRNDKLALIVLLNADKSRAILNEIECRVFKNNRTSLSKYH